MATLTQDTYDMGASLVFREVWSNGTQTGDPPAGYVATDGGGTVVRQRPLTADETAQLADLDTANLHDGNETTLHGKIAAALAANKTYLALGSPTAAQNTAEIRLLARAWNALALIVTNQLDNTSGT